MFGAREQLRNTEQNTLLAGVTAYMDVLRDTAILDLDRNNVEVLKEQLRETRDRFTVGEVTRTDVAQAEASLASAQATALSAEATLQASIARYRQVIGDQPTSARAGQAAQQAAAEDPARGDLHLADRASRDRRLAAWRRRRAIAGQGRRGRALSDGRRHRLGQPTSFDASGIPGFHVLAGQITGNITIPIYQGGATTRRPGRPRKACRSRKSRLDSVRNQVRQAVVAAWGNNQAQVGVVRAARASVSANEVALAGVREEAKVGQRTTLDVLNAQQALLQARNDAGSGRARPGRQFLLAAVGDRPAEHADPRTWRRRIRSAGPFRSGQEQVDRPEDADGQ